jgi:2'-5' RNA ligase
MYFVAIVCPAGLNQKILSFKHWMRDRFNCVVALKSPAHITLIPPFWLDEQRETELLETLRSFTIDCNEIEIEVDGFSHFGKRVMFANVKEDSTITEIKKQAEIHFMPPFSNLIKKDDRPFHPHITVANRDMKPHDFEIAWEHFSKLNFKEQFIAHTISLLKLTDSKWNVIGEKRFKV